jgi:hypothetical protein
MRSFVTVPRGGMLVLRALGRNLDVIVLLLMMAAVCNFGLSMSDLPVARDSLNSLDESWELDLVYKASQGVWSGRDFSFTYGPLWQYLASLLPRAAGVSAGSVFKLLYLYSHWSSYIFAFFAARLLLPTIESWRRAVFLVALVVFWLPVDARVGLAVFSFAVYIRLIEYLPIEPRAMLLRCACASGLLTVSFLMSGDAGALSAAGLSVILFSGLLLNLRHDGRARTLRFAVGTAACMPFWIMAVNTWAAGPFHFQFWMWSLRGVSAYRWLMALALAPEAASRLAYTLGVCGIIFILAWFTSDPKSDRITMRPLFLLASALFSCVALQKGVVRPSWGHLSQCMLPAISLSGMILIGYRSAVRAYASEIATLAAVALTVFFSGPTGLFGWTGVVNRVFWTAPPYPACPPETYYLDQACLLRHEYATFGVPSDYIQKHSGPADPIVVYPYENLFGILSRRRVSAGVLQDYFIGGEYLTNLQISTFERDRPPLGIYCTDEIVSWPVDRISNFQRTAPVWFYLQNHYVAEAEPATGVLVIRRDDARAARSQLSIHELWHESASPGVASLTIDPSRWGAPRTDFLRLKLRVAYSPLWKIAKPSALVATLQFSDGTSKVERLAVEPDRLADVWIYPWEEVNLSSYFRAEVSQWRPAGRPLPAVRALQLRAEPYDRLSVTPTSIEIQSIDGVELGLRDSPHQ